MSDKHYAHFLGMSQYFALNEACRTVSDAFGYDHYFGCYLVGSTLRTRNWRDVDVRMIMDDSTFDRMFGGIDPAGASLTPLTLLNAAVSEWIERRTGLPVDFQFQRQTDANAKFPGKEHQRNAMGICITRADIRRALAEETPE